MKLASVVLTALPILVLAAPNPTFGGSDRQHVDHVNDNVPKLDGEAPGVTRFRPDDVEYHDEYESLHSRALEARDDVDHYLEECNSDNKDKLCAYNLIVPKGQGKGVCTNRIQTNSWTGTIHIIDNNIMCKYYADANCKGVMAGPYSNELDVSPATVFHSQVISNPQSFFCQNIGFQKPNVPIKVPKPNPFAAPGYDATLNYYLAHTCAWQEVATNDDC